MSNYWILIIYFFNIHIFPVIFNFFLKYQQNNSKVIKIYFESQLVDYIQIYLVNFYAIYIISQLFTVLLFYLNKLQTHLDFIKKSRKLFYTIFLLQATFLTPPDVLSQIYTIFCLICVYEFLMVIIIIKKNLM